MKTPKKPAYQPPPEVFRLRCPFLHHGPITQCKYVAVGRTPVAAAAGVNDHLNAADAGAIGQ